MYGDGRGVERDIDEAAKWYRKAAEKGVKEAQFRLGGLYERGEGVPKDLEYAFGWYSVASHLGLARAQPARDAVRGRLQGEALDAATALAADLTAKYGQVPRTTAVEQ
jgi:TPR repeat protein